MLLSLTGWLHNRHHHPSKTTCNIQAQSPTKSSYKTKAQNPSKSCNVKAEKAAHTSNATNMPQGPSSSVTSDPAATDYKMQMLTPHIGTPAGRPVEGPANSFSCLASLGGKKLTAS